MKKLTKLERIIKILKAKEATKQEIAEELEISESQVLVNINTLRKKGNDSNPPFEIHFIDTGNRKYYKFKGGIS